VSVTELAYLPDLPSAYVRTFRARVTSLPPGAVVLDRTYFYPTGGGQPADRGTLVTDDGGRFDVVDVTKSGPAAVHRLRASAHGRGSLTVGAEVEGSLDWDRRYRHMRLHTGQHLMSAQIFVHTGVRTRRANLAGASATIDLEATVSDEQMARIVQEMDAAVTHPRDVSIRMVARSEWDAHPAAGRSGLVPLPAQVDPVRVVEIAGSDACPCGGTHLRSTAEIGATKPLPPLPLSGGGVRVGFTLLDGVQSTPPA
jgi:misacylated tRNA(Ala) deacylase